MDMLKPLFPHMNFNPPVHQSFNAGLRYPIEGRPPLNETGFSHYKSQNPLVCQLVCAHDEVTHS